MPEDLEEIVEEFDDDSDISPRKDIISETDLRTAFRCGYAYYLRTQVGMSKLPMSGTAAQALFFKNQRRKLFPKEPRAGPELKSLNRMSSSELQKVLAYHTASACGNAWRGKWFAITRDGTYVGRELVWNSKKDSNRIARQLQKVGENYYSFTLTQRPPVFGFLSKRTSFKFEGDVYLIEFPEIRSPGIIDGFSFFESKHLHTDPFVTMKLLGFCQIAHEFSDSALYEAKWGILRTTAEKWGGVEQYLDDRVQYRHVHAPSGTITVTQRTDADLDQFRRLRDCFKEIVAQERYDPNHKQCGSCSYNLVGSDGKVVCKERRGKSQPLVPKWYFLQRSYLEPEITPYDASSTEITITGKMQKRPGVEKEISTLTLKIEEGERLVVRTAYDTEVRGHGVEKILEKAGEVLQDLATRRKRDLVHCTDFKTNFKGGGQKKIAERLVKLGYEKDRRSRDYQKEYKPGQLSLFP